MLSSKVQHWTVLLFQIDKGAIYTFTNQSLYLLPCFLLVILGCTPLHWAAIRGNLEACTVLVQAGKKEDLMVTDNTGLTPAQLASDKNHRQVAFFLVGDS